MISFDIITANEADKDGDWGLKLIITDFDRNELPQFSVPSFTAKNGWTVKARKTVAIEREDKVIYLAGLMSDVALLGSATNSARADYPTKDAMLTAKMEIVEAITEWAKSGGFKQNVSRDSFSL